MLRTVRIGGVDYPAHGGVGAHLLALGGMVVGAYWMKTGRPVIGGVTFVGSPVLLHYVGLQEEGFVK